MRFDLRLLGVTSAGVKCFADISVYAGSQQELKDEADKAARQGPWFAVDSGQALIDDGATITVEHVRPLDKPPREGPSPQPRRKRKRK